MGESRSQTTDQQSPITSQQDSPVIPNPVGRPAYLTPVTIESLQPFLLQEPAPTITEIAVKSGCSRKRLWDWASQDPELANALDYAKSRHELRTLKRLESTSVDINAMFMLKAAHGYTDKPTQLEIKGEFKVIIESRVIDDTNTIDITPEQVE